MEATFKICETSRNLYLKILNSYSLEQLNKIPAGFTTNLIWNAGHIIASQQKLVYVLSGLPMMISEEFFEKYKNGSKPNGTYTLQEVNEIKRLLLSTFEQIVKDFNSNSFQNFNEYQTQTGFYLRSLDEAMQFNNYHEGIHLGFMMNIRKFI